MTRRPWFLTYERPGRNGRVAAGAAMTREEHNVLTINAKAAELAARKPATVLDTVAEAMGDLS